MSTELDQATVPKELDPETTKVDSKEAIVSTELDQNAMPTKEFDSQTTTVDGKMIVDEDVAIPEQQKSGSDIGSNNAGKDRFDPEHLEKMRADIDSVLSFIAAAKKEKEDEIDEEDDRYQELPRDIYSFIIVGDWYGIAFGLLVILFQILFLAILIIGVRTEQSDGMKICFPTDVDWDVRAAQVLSLVFYLSFPGSSLRDVVDGIDHLPSCFGTVGDWCSWFIYYRHMPWESDSSDDMVGQHRFEENLRVKRLKRVSSFLKIVIGLVAVIATFFLVMVSTSSLDVVLNFAAVNFVSDIDDEVYSLALESYFGKHLLKVAEKVKTTKLEREEMIEGYDEDSYGPEPPTASFLCLCCCSRLFAKLGIFQEDTSQYLSFRLLQFYLVLGFAVILTLFFNRQGECVVSLEEE